MQTGCKKSSGRLSKPRQRSFRKASLALVFSLTLQSSIPAFALKPQEVTERAGVEEDLSGRLKEPSPKELLPFAEANRRLLNLSELYPSIKWVDLPAPIGKKVSVADLGPAGERQRTLLAIGREANVDGLYLVASGDTIQVVPPPPDPDRPRWAWTVARAVEDYERLATLDLQLQQAVGELPKPDKVRAALSARPVSASAVRSVLEGLERTVQTQFATAAAKRQLPAVYASRPHDISAILLSVLPPPFLAGAEEPGANPLPVDPLFIFRLLKKGDPQVYDLLMMQYDYFDRAQTFIASEAHTDPLVLAAMALSQALAMKYGEGFPPPDGERYYPGLKEVLDVLENLAKNRMLEAFAGIYPDVKRRFKADVQLHSGSSANIAVYFAVLNPGDGIAALNLVAGGHLSHAFKQNVSGRVFKGFRFGVDTVTGGINYDQLEKELLELPAKDRPRVLILGGTAVTRQINWERARQITDRVTAQNTRDGQEATMVLVADISHNLGMILAGDYNNPLPFAHFITSTEHKTAGPRHAFVLSLDQVFPEINRHRGLKKEKAETTTLAYLLDRSVLPGFQGGQLFPEIAGTAVWAKVLQSPQFLAGYAGQILPNARALAAAIRKADTGNEGSFFGPEVPETHLMLLRWKGLTGKQMEQALESVDLLANMNLMPGPDSTTVDGVRIGVPAATSRGMKEPEMRIFGRLFVETLRSAARNGGQVEPEVITRVLAELHQLTTQRFPVLTEWRALFHQVDQEVGSLSQQASLAVLETATAVFSRLFQQAPGSRKERLARRLLALKELGGVPSLAHLPLLQGIVRDTREPQVIRLSAARLLPALPYTHSSQVSHASETVTAAALNSNNLAFVTPLSEVQGVLAEKHRNLKETESAGAEEQASLEFIARYLEILRAAREPETRAAAIQRLREVSEEIPLSDRIRVNSLTGLVHLELPTQLPDVSLEEGRRVRPTQVLLDKVTGEAYTYTEWGAGASRKSGLTPLFTKWRVFELSPSDEDLPGVISQNRIRQREIVLLVPKVASATLAAGLPVEQAGAEELEHPVRGWIDLLRQKVAAASAVDTVSVLINGGQIGSFTVRDNNGQVVLDQVAGELFELLLRVAKISDEIHLTYSGKNLQIDAYGKTPGSQPSSAGAEETAASVLTHYREVSLRVLDRLARASEGPAAGIKIIQGEVEVGTPVSLPEAAALLREGHPYDVLQVSANFPDRLLLRSAQNDSLAELQANSERLHQRLVELSPAVPAGRVIRTLGVIGVIGLDEGNQQFQSNAVVEWNPAMNVVTGRSPVELKTKLTALGLRPDALLIGVAEKQIWVDLVNQAGLNVPTFVIGSQPVHGTAEGKTKLLVEAHPWTSYARYPVDQPRVVEMLDALNRQVASALQPAGAEEGPLSLFKLIFRPEYAGLSLLVPRQGVEIRIITSSRKQRDAILEIRPDFAGSFLSLEEFANNIDQAVESAKADLGPDATEVRTVLDPEDRVLLRAQIIDWLNLFPWNPDSLEEALLDSVMDLLGLGTQL